MLPGLSRQSYAQAAEIAPMCQNRMRFGGRLAMADEPEKKLADEPEKKLRKRGLQTPGNLSKVSVPVIAKIFRERYRKGASSIIFSLDDVRNACDVATKKTFTPRQIGE